MDEIRAGGSCEACRSRKLGMAQILGDCIPAIAAVLLASEAPMLPAAENLVANPSAEQVAANGQPKAGGCMCLVVFHLDHLYDEHFRALKEATAAATLP